MLISATYHFDIGYQYVIHIYVASVGEKSTLVLKSLQYT